MNESESLLSCKTRCIIIVILHSQDSYYYHHKLKTNKWCYSTGSSNWKRTCVLCPRSCLALLPSSPSFPRTLKGLFALEFKPLPEIPYEIISFLVHILHGRLPSWCLLLVICLTLRIIYVYTSTLGTVSSMMLHLWCSCLFSWFLLWEQVLTYIDKQRRENSVNLVITHFPVMGSKERKLSRV